MKQTNKPAIGTDELRAAMQTLRRYKAGKANLERRIIENEQYWKLRHWEQMQERGTTALKTRSAWLVNVILSKHADAMDAFPEPNCLPREQGDEAEARLLTRVVPLVLQQNDFELTWSDNWWKKLKAGVAFYGVFWDVNALGGAGDVAIRRIDPLNLYWEPGIDDLQKSRNLFHVELQDNESLTEEYPQLEGRLNGGGFLACRYLFDDNVDTADKTPVIDWYYKKCVGGRTVLHYVKFVGETVLYATENDDGRAAETAQTQPPAETGGPETGAGAGPEPGTAPGDRAKDDAYAPAVRGLYDHGAYPFFADVLFPEEGTPAGFGYVDLCKDAQRQIDLMNNAIVANCIAAATPRWLKRGDDGVNEEEYADWTKPFVHVQGSIEENALRQIAVHPLSGNYLNILASKINELKETSGNRDVNNGGVGGGVTAASAIAAMQEQSGKLSRDQIQNSYRCFRQIVYCVISLIRQFYTAPRRFRILGEDGGAEYLLFDNRGLQAVEPASLDIEVCAQRQSPYTRLSANELGMQFFQAGFFHPQLADQALAALEMMDFKGKDAMCRRIRQNAALSRELARTRAQLQALRDLIGPPGSLFAAPEPGEEGPEPDGEPPFPRTKAAPAAENRRYDAMGNALKRNGIVERARARAAAASRPREKG